MKTRVLASLLVWMLSVGFTGGVQAQGVRNAWEMPPLLLPDLNGEQRSLYDWHGNVIVLNFWATWCGPCQQEVPRLIDWQDAFYGDGLRVVSVGLDDPGKLKNVVRTLGVNYPVLVADPDADRKLLTRWGDPRNVLPFTVVIDRDGNLHYMHVGVFEAEEFEVWVKPLL